MKTSQRTVRVLGGLLAVLATLVLALPAHAAKPSAGKQRKAINAAAANWKRLDSLELTSKGILVERYFGDIRRPFTAQGTWTSSINPKWARVIVETDRDELISTVLVYKFGKWRVLSSLSNVDRN